MTKLLSWDSGKRGLLNASLYYNRKRRRERQADPNPPIAIDATQLLLHFNEDTQVTDSSIHGRNGTLVNAAGFSRFFKVFGNAALYLRDGEDLGLDDHATFLADDIFAIGWGVPFECDFRYYPQNKPITSTFEVISAIDAGTFAGWALVLNGDPPEFSIISGIASTGMMWTATSDLHSGWNAIKFNYDGVGLYRFYIDGVLQGQPQAPNNPLPDVSTSLFSFGGRLKGGNESLAQVYDEFRWNKHPDLVIETRDNYEVATEPFPDP